MITSNVKELVADLFNAESEEEIILILKAMSQESSHRYDIQKPILLNRSKKIDSTYNQMIINCWINGVYKELDLDKLIQSFKDFHSNKIN